jgi:hypothetical protein
VGGPLAAFAAGVAVGTVINETTGVDDTASDIGQNAKQLYLDAGFP